MTENHRLQTQAVALVKFFSEEEHYLSFKKGMSLFRTPHYYRRNEDTGRGDRSESCLGYWDTRLGDNLPTIKDYGVQINIEDAQSVLIYPAVEQNDAWLQSWAVIGPHNNFVDSLQRLLDEFGTYFVILPVSRISAYARLIAKASGCEVNMGTVNYSDDPLKRSLVVKDAKYSYQKEFRFLIGECGKEEVNDKMIYLQEVDKLLLNASTLKISGPSGEVRCCHLGQKNVVKLDIT